MSNTKTIEAASGVIRKLWERHGIQEPFRFLGFCLSMLPIPVIQAAGQALDRHLGDKAFQKDLAEIWDAIKEVNDVVAQVTTMEEAIKVIAETVDKDKALLNEAERFSRALGCRQSEFSMLTEQASYQELVHSLVVADVAQIIAIGHSTNVVEGTKFQASSTHLHAHDNSQNFVHRTTFSDGGCSVRMDGITTKGDIFVEGNSVGFGPGGSLIFGGNPNLVSGECPLCRGSVEVDRRQLTGYSHVQCPHCGGRLPFSIS